MQSFGSVPASFFFFPNIPIFVPLFERENGVFSSQYDLR